ncbi:MAG: hypothetical protein L6R28_16010, partial [Planctomycetes bacterium]|nr:hypothetical protein [Planctomycetota bacterium]
ETFIAVLTYNLMILALLLPLFSTEHSIMIDLQQRRNIENWRDILDQDDPGRILSDVFCLTNIVGRTQFCRSIFAGLTSRGNPNALCAALDSAAIQTGREWFLVLGKILNNQEFDYSCGRLTDAVSIDLISSLKRSVRYLGKSWTVEDGRLKVRGEDFGRATSIKQVVAVLSDSFDAEDGNKNPHKPPPAPK